MLIAERLEIDIDTVNDMCDFNSGPMRRSDELMFKTVDDSVEVGVVVVLILKLG